MHSHSDAGESIELPDRFPLREDWVLHPQNRTRQVVLEDTRDDKFYRIGEAEAEFMVALRESGSALDAFRNCHASHPEFSQIRADRFCKWLLTIGMVASNAAPQPMTSGVRNPFLAAFFWKLPLVNPDLWLTSLVQRCGWLLSPKVMLGSLIVPVLGVLITVGKWSEFLASYENLFSSWRWLWIAVSWVLLKLIHETAHGATCRRYGGEVKEAGLAMILFVPIAFVNVTSSWRFPSRWQRLHVTLAGVVVELLVAGVALIAWNLLDSPPLQQAAADVVLMASVSSILFNLNPLLKFDGYFALADATGIDNLYQYGQSYARYFGGRYFLGLNLRPPKLPGRQTGWIKIYGCAAAAYRVTTVAGLLAAAAAIFHGAGILITAAGIGSFILKPLVQLIAHLVKLHREGQLSWFRLSLRTSLLTSIAVVPLWWLPASGSWTSPGIVQYNPPAVLRSRSPGFVDRVHVVDGEYVHAGTPIVSMRNDELPIKLLRKRKELAHAEQEVMSARWLGKSNELVDAETRTEALRKQVNQLQLEVDDLIVRTPVDGYVTSRRLSFLPGTFVEPGEELAVIGREDVKRVKVSLSQSDARQADLWNEKPLRVIVDHQETFVSKLSRIETRADITPADESILAIHGGSLAATQEGEERWVLCEPRVDGFIELTPAQRRRLRCGQRASVRLASEQASIGGLLWMRLWSYLSI